MAKREESKPKQIKVSVATNEYSGPAGYFRLYYAYGLAGDSEGNVYEVQYDSRGWMNLSVGKRSQVFDDNRIKVTRCIKLR